MLKGKHIVLGITGSIAAYKSAILARLLVKKGAEVQVVITPSGKEFITPVTLSAITNRPVISDFFSRTDGVWYSHVDIGLWADAMVIAPATASTIGKMVNGIADNMLITTYLSIRSKVFIAPAMDLDMFKHPSTTENINILKGRNNNIIEPERGELASGLIGQGRMQEPEEIVKILEDYFYNNTVLKSSLIGKKAVITAGPTHEYIDPVRYIGNKSTGLMGICIANELTKRGVDVTLVLGPSDIRPNDKVQVENIVSAEEMLYTTQKFIDNSDIVVFTAAVADYRPKIRYFEKIKRQDKDNLSLELEKNPDIAKSLGLNKKSNQLFVGFSLETNKIYDEPIRKLKDKNLDIIILNSLEDEGAGFGVKTNKITIFSKDGQINEYELKNKELVAVDIVDYICEKFSKSDE